MTRRRTHQLVLALSLATAAACSQEAAAPPADTSSATARLEGMWTDAPTTPEGVFCYFFCTDVGLERLEALLDDPANDDRPYRLLRAEADTHQRGTYIEPRLTESASKDFPLNPADDPGFLLCEPWGLARQMFAPHQLEIRPQGDQLQMRYGEWAATRVVYLNGALGAEDRQPTRLGFSVGRYEGEALVIETTGIASNWALYASEPSSFRHSNQLHVVERYRRSGDELHLTATLTDPESLREPLVIKKIWTWSPESRITPYDECEPPTEFSREVK